MIKRALLSMGILSMMVVLFACGGENQNSDPSNQTGFTKPLFETEKCSDVATIAASKSHTVGLTKDGNVVTAGKNDNGQLDVSTWKKIKAIATGNKHTVGLTEDGYVVAEGYNGYHERDTKSWTGIKAIAVGTFHTVGLKNDGTVEAIGANGNNQCDVKSWKGIKAIAAGPYATIGVKEDGTLEAKGLNDNYQLDVKSWTDIKAVAAGRYHTVGLKNDGTLEATGNDDYGQRDVKSEKWTKIKAIAVGLFFTIGLKEDGTVVFAGQDVYELSKVKSWTKIKAIAAGDEHAVGLKEDGTIVTAGNNVDGQLNVSSFTNIMPMCSAATDKIQDEIPPKTEIKPDPNGWYASDVLMTLNAVDDEDGSGVKEIHYSVDGAETVVPGDSASHSVQGEGIHPVMWYAIDNAGNEETTHEAKIMIDKTPPVITTTISPAPNADGWNNTDVTVRFVCSDALSGIASCPDPIQVITEGAGQTVYDSAFDKAGNTATASVTVNIDKTPPTVDILAGPSVLWPPNHKIVNVQVGGSISDGVSGIASTVFTVNDEYGFYNRTVSGLGASVPLESWREGTDMDGRVYTINAVITDRAGNQSTGATTVLVPHDMRHD